MPNSQTLRPQRLPPPGPCYVKACPLNQPPASVGVLEGPLRKDLLVAFPHRGGQEEGVMGSSPQHPATTSNHLCAILLLLPVSLEPWKSS